MVVQKYNEAEEVIEEIEQMNTVQRVRHVYATDHKVVGRVDPSDIDPPKMAASVERAFEAHSDVTVHMKEPHEPTDAHYIVEIEQLAAPQPI